jgi:hypothetical protein
MNFLDDADAISPEIKARESRVQEVSIECKSSREINNVAIE